MHKLFADAWTAGISAGEIEEDTGSVYEVILDAIVHHDRRRRGMMLPCFPAWLAAASRKEFIALMIASRRRHRPRS
jgi:hypothetical protein